MNLKGLLPQDVDGLRDWLENVRVTMGLNLAETFLIRVSVGRIAANQIRAQANRKMAEGWWDPMPSAGQLSHIIDWLVADFDAGAPWLANLDERGRPKKLLKCSSYEDLVREADKSMDRKNAQAVRALGPEDEQHIADLGNGYTLVRMFTPEALDIESRRMSHCVGHGSYDKKLTTDWFRYLSVRDAKRRPTATIELRQEPNARWSISQCYGKRNARPDREVMDILRPYAAAQDWQDRHYWWHTVVDVDDVEHDVDRIPAGSTIIGDLNAGGDVVDILGIFDLPRSLTVSGNVTLSPRVRIPENLTVWGTFEIEPCRIVVDDGHEGVVLPKSLHVDKEIRAFYEGDIARPIPAHLHHLIRVERRKLVVRHGSEPRWEETVECLQDGDDAEPSLGM
ncbi:PcfJ domain-containing protein [Mesorhizobium sp. 2RAF21]|uniref:PcfJ domain-containing protein n=1 Tax=Mesorhizobium sp. 2RAF21 TaxID=3232995 RepID=UPI003F9B6F5D